MTNPFARYYCGELVTGQQIRTDHRFHSPSQSTTLFMRCNCNSFWRCSVVKNDLFIRTITVTRVRPRVGVRRLLRNVICIVRMTVWVWASFYMAFPPSPVGKPLTHKVQSTHYIHIEHASFQETGREPRISWISLQASCFTTYTHAWAATQTARTHKDRFSQHRDRPSNEMPHTLLTVAGKKQWFLSSASHWPQTNSEGYGHLKIRLIKITSILKYHT